MLNFPSTSFVHLELKPKALFRDFSASKEAKDEAALIESMFLEYVLNEKTLPNPSKAKEIYVFVINMKTQIVPLTFLKEFDRYVKLSTCFVFRFQGQEYEIMAYKNGYVPTNYFHTNWERESATEMPLGMDLDELYAYMFSRLLPYKPRRNEASSDYLKRYNRLSQLDKEIEKLEGAIRREEQPKKKFECNNRCNALKKERESLLGGD